MLRYATLLILLLGSTLAVAAKPEAPEPHGKASEHMSEQGAANANSPAGEQVKGDMRAGERHEMKDAATSEAKGGDKKGSAKKTADAKKKDQGKKITVESKSGKESGSKKGQQDKAAPK